MRQAQLHDGTILEFPDETQDSVIDSVVKQHLGQNQTSQFDERKKQFNDILNQQNISAPSKVYQAGSVAGGVAGDLIGNAIAAPFKGVDYLANTVSPGITDPIKQGAQNLAQKIAGNSMVQSGVQRYGQFKQDHPEAAGNIEATGRYLNLVPVGFGSKAAGKSIETVGAALETSGKNLAMKQRDNFVQDLITPKQTPTVRAELFAKSKEKGVLRNRVVEPDSNDTAIINAVSQLPVKKSQSLMKNYEVISDANTAEAENLSKYLADNDVAIPDDHILNEFTQVEKDIGESPYITAVNGKEAANRVIDGAMKALSGQPKTASGLLQARKDFDKWVAKFKGEKGFDPTVESAATMAIQRTRQAMNNVLDKSIPDAGVKQSLRTQSLLYRAMDNIETKGGEEAKNMLSRLAQKAGEGIPGKTAGVKATVGALGLGALGGTAAITSPAVVGGGLATYGLAKAALSPTARKVAGSVTKTTGRLMQGKK